MAWCKRDFFQNQKSLVSRVIVRLDEDILAPPTCFWNIDQNITRPIVQGGQEMYRFAVLVVESKIFQMQSCKF